MEKEPSYWECCHSVSYRPWDLQVLNSKCFKYTFTINIYIFWKNSRRKWLVVHREEVWLDCHWIHQLSNVLCEFSTPRLNTIWEYGAEIDSKQYLMNYFLQSVHIAIKGFIVMPILCYVLLVHDCVIGIMGLISGIEEGLVFAFATKGWHMYFGVALSAIR